MSIAMRKCLKRVDYVNSIKVNKDNGIARTTDHGHQDPDLWYCEVLDKTPDSVMDSGKKTLIFITFCAFVGDTRSLDIINNLAAVVSVPSNHIGDTVIGSAVLSISATHPLLYTFVAPYTSTNKAPTLDVSVTSVSSTGTTFTYFNSTQQSVRLVINVDSQVSVTPQFANGGGDNITVILDILYNTSTTSMGSFGTSRPNSTAYALNAKFTTTKIDQKNGQSALCCGPLSALILLALIPGLLLK
ncbi:uncharacterized protein [Dendropsophus ebraccatus]|uniref:uncharacterized protein n=1 Tax=Dendropsophus ebraccatus TaxID=150705 RepID=UPI00383154BE